MPGGCQDAISQNPQRPKRRQFRPYWTATPVISTFHASSLGDLRRIIPRRLQVVHLDVRGQREDRRSAPTNDQLMPN